MSVVAAAVYRDGKRIRALSFDDRDGWALDEGEFAWVGLHEPDEAELRWLEQRFSLHPLAVEDALMAHQLPKVEAYGQQLFVVTLTARLEGEAISYGETAVFVGRQHIITVRHGSIRAHTSLRDQLEAAPDLLKHGVDYVLHGVLDFIVDGYQPVEEQIEEEILEMERRALEASFGQDDVRRIFQLRGELLRFRRILGPMREMCSRLQHLDVPCIDADVRPYFRDVYDHVRRVEATADGLRDVLTSVFEASLLLESQRQGAITRQLAAWAGILAVPTAIAGVYGMNFQNMPELKWRYGYFLVMGVILGLCGLLYLRFRRWGWL